MSSRIDPLQDGPRGRQQIRKLKAQKIKAYAKEIIERAWPAADQANIQQFYLQIDEEFRNHYLSPPSYGLLRTTLLRFIRNENKKREIPLQEPSVPIRLEREIPVKNLDWLVEGRKISNLADLAIKHWSQHAVYSDDEILGWTLFSAALWGALNDVAALNDFLLALTTQRPVYRFINNLMIIHLDAEDTYYGNQFEHDDNNNKLTRSYTFMPDSVTRSWMVRLLSKKIEIHTLLSMESLLRLVLNQLEQTSSDSKSISVSNFLKYASYHWEQLPEVKIDQALTRVADGHQKCVSLSTLSFSQFYAPSTISPSTVKLDRDALLTGSMPDLEKRESLPPCEQEARNLTADIRQILSKADDINTALDQLINKSNAENSRRLIAWIKYLFLAEHGKKLKNETILRYMDAVAHPWLIQTFDEDVALYSALDFENAYEEILNLKSPKSRSYDGNQLYRFHRFQQKYFQAPLIQFRLEKNLQICRANVISSTVYNTMLDVLHKATGIDDHNRRTFKLLIILAFRTGMRREEIVKLQFRDIERGEQLAFIVRDSATGKIKTSSAFRRIPVWALLKEDELELLRSHLTDSFKLAKMRLSAVLFSASGTKHKLPSELPSRLFKILLQQVQPEARLSFHAFRHTTLTNLTLVLNAPKDLTTHLTDYSVSDCVKIRMALLGKEHYGQDRWFALAQVAGHLTPNHTFEHYIHCAHLMIGYALNQSPLELPLVAINNITGYSSQKIARHNPDAIRKGFSRIQLEEISALIARDISPILHVRAKAETNHHQENRLNNKHKYIDKSYLLDKMFDERPREDAHPLSMSTVHSVLSRIEQGAQRETIAEFYHIPEDLIQIWIDRANQLAQLKTQRGESKLFAKSRLKNHTNKLLAPALPPSRREQEIIADFFTNVNKLPEHVIEDLHTFLNLFFERVSSSKSEIRFTLDERYLLRDFVSMGKYLVNTSHWRLYAPTINQARQLKKDFDFDDHLSIGEQNTYNGYSLAIKHPDEKSIVEKSASQKHVSSGLLKYACHMLAIVDRSYEIKNVSK